MLGTLRSDNWGCWLCPTPFIELLLCEIDSRLDGPLVCSLLTLASSSPVPFEDEHRKEALTVLRLERGSRLELAGVVQVLDSMILISSDRDLELMVDFIGVISWK